MARYLAIRVLSIVPVLAVVAVVGFALLRLMPGDPATPMLPFNATAAQVAALRQQLGLDRPMVVEFSRYCQRLLEDDLGRSLFFRQPVTAIIATRAESPLLLAALSGALAVAVAVPAGVWAAARRGTWIDQTLQAASLTVVSSPAFWFGLILILVFAVRYHGFR
jgi:peptide/nickel transport system permease protein